MSFDPGRVRILLQCAAGVVTQTAVSCVRPDLARLLCGREAEQVVQLIPLVYSLCGRAQGVAARAALAAARGTALSAQIDGAVWAEAVREHAWKLFVDWPGQLGLPADEAFFVRLMRVPQGPDGALREALAAHPLPARLCAAAGESPSAALFGLRTRERLGALRDWLDHRPGELGTVAAVCLAPGEGEGRVATARGMLVHRLTLEGERVSGYRIVAPTDRHFAPDGEAARCFESLVGLARDAAERQVKLLALGFDPCVPWDCCSAQES
jgi:coenzyme F420-reducing hydrogenase alpha subunit